MRHQPVGEGPGRLPGFGRAQHRIDHFVEQLRLVDHVLGKAQHGRRFGGHQRRDQNFELAFGHQFARVPLQRVAEIDRHRQGLRLALGKGRSQREQPRRPREDHRDRVDIDPGNLLARQRDRSSGCQSFDFCRRNQSAQRVEQESARTAGRIDHTLFERPFDHRRANPCREPVRCVIFAQIVTLSGVDQTFIKALKHIGIDCIELEALRLPRDAEHQRIALRLVAQQPVEEIGLDRVENAQIAKRQTVEQVLSGIGQPTGQRHGRHSLGQNNQIGVLQEQFRRVDLGAIGDPQQPVPQLALQHDFGMTGEPGPHRAQFAHGPLIEHRFTAQFDPDARNIRLQFVLERDNAFKPAQELGRFLDIRDMRSQLDQRVACFRQFMHRECRAIGDDPDEILAGQIAAIFEITGKLGFERFAPEIGLQFDHGAPEQGIDPPTNFERLMLERDVRRFCTEPIGQQLVEQPAHLLVSRTGQEFGDNFLKVALAQCHHMLPAHA